MTRSRTGTRGAVVAASSSNPTAAPTIVACSDPTASLRPQGAIVPVTNHTECLVALQDGRVDAITADLPPARYQD